MLNIRKHERLSEGIALVETADGRWFLAYATLVETSHQAYLLEDPPLILSALASFHDQRSGYDCHEAARDACHAWCETAELTQEWRRLTARTELYPERNAWYLDEITQLAGGDTPRLHCGISVHAMVLARRTTGNEVITATGNTPDEAIEALYQRVYQWSCTLFDTTYER